MNLLPYEYEYQKVKGVVRLMQEVGKWVEKNQELEKKVSKEEKKQERQRLSEREDYFSGRMLWR
jgi:hypothetical protein